MNNNFHRQDNDCKKQKEKRNLIKNGIDDDQRNNHKGDHNHCFHPVLKTCKFFHHQLIQIENSLLSSRREILVSKQLACMNVNKNCVKISNFLWCSFPCDTCIMSPSFDIASPQTMYLPERERGRGNSWKPFWKTWRLTTSLTSNKLWSKMLVKKLGKLSSKTWKTWFKNLENMAKFGSKIWKTWLINLENLTKLGSKTRGRSHLSGALPMCMFERPWCKTN